MKKLILFGAALFIAVASFGQAKTGFSASAGWDTEFYNYGGEDFNPASLNGFFLRGDYEYAFTEHSGVSGGIRLDFIGFGDSAKIAVATTAGEISRTVTWKKTYLDVPIKYNAHFGGFYLNAGPVVKFLLSYNHTEKDEPSGTSTTINDLKDNPGVFNSVFFGLGGGLGYVFNVGLKLYLEYDYNFTNVVKNPGTELPTTSKPSVITLGIGYNF